MSVSASDRINVLQIVARALSPGYEFEPTSDIVCSPGRFQGEPLASLYYAECEQNGDGDAHGAYTIFKTEQAERQILGTSADYYVLLHSEQGFISGEERDDVSDIESEPEDSE
jgi:hypothetical protein